MTQFRQQRAPIFAGALLLALSIALLTALSGPQPAAAEDDYLLIEARVVAQRHDDGRVEVLLEVRRDSAGWVEQIKPVHRFLPDPAPIGVWWNSTPPLTVPGVPGQFGITARRDARGRVELGLQRVTGVHWGERLLPRFGRLDSPRYGSDRVYTSSIDLLDEGPQVCALGTVLNPGERCRLPDTRDEFVVEPDGSAHYPHEPGRESSIYIVVPSLHGLEHDPSVDASVHGIHVERLADDRYMFIRLGRDLLHPANGADCVQGLLVPFGHYCGIPATTAGYVWFVVYPQGPAHLSIPNFELSWVSDADLHAETIPVDYLPHYRVDAVREDAGWRISTLVAPGSDTPRVLSDESVQCSPGLILPPGDSCADPTSTQVFSVAADGGITIDDGPLLHVAFGTGAGHHPNGRTLSFHPLASGDWLVTRIRHHPDDLTEIGLCTIGLVVYPGEVCIQTGRMWFRVFANGLASSVNTTSFERINIAGRTIRYGGGSVAQYELTAERQSDGGFLITWMRERWPVLESRVQRERGDCSPGLILSAGDGCRYPNSRELLVVSQDGSASFGAVGGRYPDGFYFVPWGGVTQQSVLYEPLRDGRQIVVRIGADTPRSIGNCAVGLSVSPGQSCRTGPDLPRFHVFDDAALYDGVVAHNDLEVEGGAGAPRLRAERQPDRSYIIRELG